MHFMRYIITTWNHLKTGLYRGNENETHTNPAVRCPFVLKTPSTSQPRPPIIIIIQQSKVLRSNFRQTFNTERPYISDQRKHKAPEDAFTPTSLLRTKLNLKLKILVYEILIYETLLSILYGIKAFKFGVYAHTQNIPGMLVIKPYTPNLKLKM